MRPQCVVAGLEIGLDGWIVDFIVRRARTRPGSVRHHRESLDHEVRHQRDFRLALKHGGVDDAFGDDEHALRGPAHDPVPVRGAEHAYVALHVDLVAMDHGEIGLDRRNDPYRIAVAVRIVEALPIVEGRNIAALEAAAGLERNAVGCRTQAGSEGGASMLLELDRAPFDGFAIKRRQAEVAFHRHDAGAHLAHNAGAAKDVDVVAGRLLHDLEIALALANQLADEREWAAMQKAAAEGDRCAVRDSGHQVLQRAALVVRAESGCHECLLANRCADRQAAAR